jgi:hypothetical protein
VSRSRLALAAFLLAVMGALAACAPPDTQGAHALLGAWVGSVTYQGESTPLTLEITPKADSLAAVFGAPELGVAHAVIARFAYAKPRVHFVVPAAADTLAFDGYFRRGILVGVVTSRTIPATERLVLLPQFGFHRPQKKLELAGVDSTFNAPAPQPLLPPATPRADTLADWLRSR